jgi:DNA polymerase-4
MLVLHIDMDAFYVSCERTRNPSLWGKPVIVGGPFRRRGVVASASYEARQFGIKSGMAVSYARRLCPEAIFIKPDFQFYEDVSKKVYETLLHFSPIVAMTSIDEAYLDITNCQKLFGPPLELGRRIKDEIRNLGLPSTVGIAKNPTLAKIATRLAKPDGILFLPPGAEEKFIAHHPVTTIPGIGDKSAQELEKIGIKTIGDFLNSPDSLLVQIMGKWGKKIKENLKGEFWLEIREKPKSISRNLTLPQDTRDIDYLEKILYQLLKEASFELREWQEKAGIITCRVRFSDFTTFTKRKRIIPTDAQQIIFPVTRELFRSLIKMRREKIRLLGVTLSGFTSPPPQLSLFLSPEKEIALKRLNQTLDKLRKKLGGDKIKEGRIFPLPERIDKPLIPYRQIYQKD